MILEAACAPYAHVCARLEREDRRLGIGKRCFGDKVRRRSRGGEVRQGQRKRGRRRCKGRRRTTKAAQGLIAGIASEEHHGSRPPEQSRGRFACASERNSSDRPTLMMAGLPSCRGNVLLYKPHRGMPRSESQFRRLLETDDGMLPESGRVFPADRRGGDSRRSPSTRRGSFYG